MIRRSALLAVGAALIGACAGASSSGVPGDSTDATEEEDLTGRACTPAAARAAGLTLSVLPEAGEAPFVDVLRTAKKSIRLMVYMLGEDGVFDALKERAAAGVDVKVILDGNAKRTFNQPAFDALGAAHVPVKWSDPSFSFMHAKSFVVDDKVAVISTGNFPKGLILDERNYVARDTDRADVKVLAAIFDADWAGKAPTLSCTRLLVSPVNSKARLLELIGSAKKALLIESLALADPEVLSAIIDRKRAAVDVRVVLADPKWSATNANEASALTLKAAAVPARFIPKSRMLVHVKSVLVDGARGYMGSENLTTTSLTKNREIGLVVTDLASLRTMESTFETDFASAESF